ncbi:MAG: hypothetical protein OXC02_03040 [Rhodobacteraceae bacterium]|nr:hypothetical protein [Paracoccaceae bacterium]
MDGLGFISTRDLPHLIDSINFTQETIDQARDFYNILIAKIQSNLGLNTAITRWIKSKESKYSITDSLIELRTALESLYLNDMNRELRFRLAIKGAWHIGQCFERRKFNFETLSNTYKLSSKAEHGSNIPIDDRNKKLLKKAQNICREGILKRLREEKEISSNDLVLGIKS